MNLLTDTEETTSEADANYLLFVNDEEPRTSSQENESKSFLFLSQLKNDLMSFRDPERLIHKGWVHYYYHKHLYEITKLHIFLLFLAFVKSNIELFWQNDTIIDLIFYQTICLVSVFWVMFTNLRISFKFPHNTPKSEADFSCFVRNLPTSLKENDLRKTLQDHINKALQTSEINGAVKEIIFLQEYRKFEQLSRKKKSVEKEIKFNPKSIAKDYEIEKKIDEFKREARNFDGFKGNAIVIFNSPRTKTLFVQSLFLRIRARFNIDGSVPYFFDIPEPSEIRLRNISVSYITFILKWIGAFILQTILLLILFLTISFTIAPAGILSSINEIFYIPAIIIFLMLIPLCCKLGIKGLNNLVPYSSKTAKYIAYVSHTIFHCMCTGFQMHIHYYNGGAGLAAYKIRIALFVTLFSKPTKAILKNHSQTALKSLSTYFPFLGKFVIEPSPFDFWSAFHDLSQLLAIGFCCLPFSPIIVLILNIILFFRIYQMDKYQLIVDEPPTRLRSFQIGWILSLTIPLTIHLCFSMVNIMIAQKSDEQTAAWLRLMTFYGGIFIVCASIVVCKLISDLLKRRYSDVEYDTAKSSFLSRYNQEYQLYYPPESELRYLQPLQIHEQLVRPRNP